MSVTTYYGRVSPDEYEAMRRAPEGLSRFIDGTLPEERLLYLDKATPVIAWLLSPLKRHEQAHFAAVCTADDLDTFVVPDLGPQPPMDELLIPIEGRGVKDEALDVGMGPACVLSESDVERYASMLQQVDEPRLREQLDFQALEDAALPVDYWLEEGDEIFSGYILPLFHRLQAFYAQAATEKQLVLAWYH